MRAIGLGNLVLFVLFLCNVNVSYAEPLRTTSIPARLADDEKELMRAVMNEFYGSLDGRKACWISKHEDATYCMKPTKLDIVSSADRKMLFIVAGGQQLDESGEPLESHPAVGALGLIVLTTNGANLGVVATNGLYEAYESYGRPPRREDVKVRELGPNGAYGWVANLDEVHSGEQYRWSNVYGVVGDSVTLLTKITTHYANPMTCESEGQKFCIDLSVDFVFDARTSGSSFYPLVLRVSGIRNGKLFSGNYRVAFDGNSLTYPLPSKMPDEIK